MNNNVENKKENNDSNKQRNIILVIISAVILLIILLIGIKSCTPSNKYNIDFIVNDKVYHTIQTSGKETLEFPSDPSTTGYYFNGWYFEDTFDTKFNSTFYSKIKLEEDIEVYAEFVIQRHTITYIDEFNQTHENQTSITMNETITLLSLDDKSDNFGYGYRFLGWFLDEECTQHIDTLSNITSDLNLYSSYEKYSIGLSYTEVNGQYHVSGKGAAFHGDIIIPSMIDGMDVVAIAEDCFKDNLSIESIIIPDSVLEIFESSIEGCTYLTSVKLPKYLTIIDIRVFLNCVNIKEIVVPENVVYIAGSAFSGCTSLTDVTLPNGLTGIGSYAFRSCSGLINITLPDTLTEIDIFAFQHCLIIPNITIPASVTKIGQGAFERCLVLTITFELTEAEVNEKVTFGKDWDFFAGEVVYKQ
ncbi:MAG: leucine-rich repeat protein [bacterium]